MSKFRSYKGKIEEIYTKVSVSAEQSKSAQLGFEILHAECKSFQMVSKPQYKIILLTQPRGRLRDLSTRQ